MIKNEKLKKYSSLANICEINIDRKIFNKFKKCIVSFFLSKCTLFPFPNKSVYK